MNNSQLRSKPFYIRHREVDGAPVAADSATLATVLAANPRSTADCAGYKTIKGFVRLTGGAAPTVVLQPLELVKYPEGTDFLVVAGANTAALASGDAFDVTVNGAFLFLRLNTIANNPTKVEIFFAGAETMCGMPGAGRS
jgi:hypothetical protein